jgi:hypothetical protein
MSTPLRDNQRQESLLSAIAKLASRTSRTRALRESHAAQIQGFLEGPSKIVVWELEYAEHLQQIGDAEAEERLSAINRRVRPPG